MIVLLGVLFLGVGGWALVWYVQHRITAKRQADPVVEQYKRTGDTFGCQRARLLDEVGPCVVAGSDLDLSDAQVNLRFAVQTLPYADEERAYEAGLLAYYVVPEVER